MLTHSLAFDVKNPPWSEIPAEAGVFALFGADERAEPYLNRTPDLRRRLKRLLDPKPEQSKRLQLAAQIRRIEYTRTGSEFEALLCLYQASVEAMGERARERMHLRAPVFLRMSMQNEFPRVYPATRLTLKAAEDLFGPFPSRWMAERWLEQMLNLFLLRRCQEDLEPDPAFAGCIYSEMRKCLAPCFEGCTPAMTRKPRRCMTFWRRGARACGPGWRPSAKPPQRRWTLRRPPRCMPGWSAWTR